MSAGQTLGVVGSSGCSTQPHLHLELLDESGAVLDAFLDELNDSPPDATTISLGSTIAVGLSMAGGTSGDVIRVTIRDDGGVLRHDFGTTLQQTYRHSYWSWNLVLAAGTPGSWTIRVYTNGALRREYGFAVP